MIGTFFRISLEPPLVHNIFSCATYCERYYAIAAAGEGWFNIIP